MTQILVLALSTANFASFLWSVIGVFKAQRDRLSKHYVALQINTILIWVCSIYFEWTTPPLAEPLNWTLSAIQLFCLVAFWMHTNIVRKNQFSIVFSKDAPRTLVQQGFYSRVRHPFYMIYLICYFSISLSYANPILIALSLSIAAIYYRAARFEESKFMNSELASEYQTYRQRTHMFAPRLTPFRRDA